jgi:polyhydroxyalkanoate synthesis regulator phasin
MEEDSEASRGEQSSALEPVTHRSQSQGLAELAGRALSDIKSDNEETKEMLHELKNVVVELEERVSQLQGRGSDK